MTSTTPDPRNQTSPSQIPRNVVAAPPPSGPSSDACLNFNLPDSRIVCLSVPIGVAEADVPFVLAVLQAHVTAVARRGR